MCEVALYGCFLVLDFRQSRGREEKGERERERQKKRQSERQRKREKEREWRQSTSQAR